LVELDEAGAGTGAAGTGATVAFGVETGAGAAVVALGLELGVDAGTLVVAGAVVVAGAEDEAEALPAEAVPAAGLEAAAGVLRVSEPAELEPAVIALVPPATGAAALKPELISAAWPA